MPKKYTAAEQVIDPAKRYTATISTDRGDIVIALDPARAPKTVNNFVFLARDGFYDGLTFHRIVDDFVIQGGCPEGTGRGGPGYKFDDEPVQGEYEPEPSRWRTPGRNTNGSQFFICTVDDRQKLTKSYNLFGQVIKGMDVVGAIRKDDVMRSVTIVRGVMADTQLRLMAVHAHCDDETITMGGTLATYADRGVKTCVVCCTDGKLATIVDAGHARGDDAPAPRRDSRGRVARGLPHPQGG